MLLPGDPTVHIAVHKAEWGSSMLRELIFLRNVCLKFRKIMPVISLTLLFTKLNTIRELHTPPPTLPTSVPPMKLTNPLKKITRTMSKQKVVPKKNN